MSLLKESKGDPIDIDSNYMSSPISPDMRQRLNLHQQSTYEQGSDDNLNMSVQGHNFTILKHTEPEMNVGGEDDPSVLSPTFQTFMGK